MSDIKENMLWTLYRLGFCTRPMFIILDGVKYRYDVNI